MLLQGWDFFFFWPLSGSQDGDGWTNLQDTRTILWKLNCPRSRWMLFLFLDDEFLDQIKKLLKL